MINDLLGKNIAGKYRIDSLIRETELGDFYRGTNTSTGVPVTIKILAPAMAIDVRYVDRFLAEAIAAAFLAGTKLGVAATVAIVAHAVPQQVGDFAVLLEPTDARVEGGCKGTLRAEVSTKGIASHSARPWKGHNAIHDAGSVLTRLAAYEAETITVDGLDYHEALQAVGISGGIAGNVIPDRCTVTVNYRYAPDKNTEEAFAHVRRVFEGFEVTLSDAADGARPGLHLPAAKAFIDALGVTVNPKEGWTDVARFSAMGVPAVNFGPGDPNLAHMDDEQCPVEQYTACEAALLRWLA